MVRYTRHPASYGGEFKNFDIISPYHIIEVSDGNSNYTKIIKDSKEDFENELKNLEIKVKESIKTKVHKLSKKKR